MNEQAPLLTSIVLAGYSPDEDDPLAAYTMGRSKALIPIAGRPMVSYVVDALSGSQYVHTIAVIGLPPDERASLPSSIVHLEDQGSLLANIESGIRWALGQTPPPDGVLVSSSDIPLLTSPIVDQFVAACMETDHDVYYGIVERAAMEARFPTSRRTYVRLVEGEFAGGDLSLLRNRDVAVNRGLWQRLSDARKNPLKQARLLGGIGPVIRLLTGRLRLADVEQRASRALGVHGRAVICPHPEIGMDVDKPFQLEIARAELEGRAGGG